MLVYTVQLCNGSSNRSLCNAFCNALSGLLCSSHVVITVADTYNCMSVCVYCVCILCVYTVCVQLLQDEDVMFCPNGHDMVPFVVPNNSFKCDMCGDRVPRGEMTARCGCCNYDVCENCFAGEVEGM
jgi:hypothetical protein